MMHLLGCAGEGPGWGVRVTPNKRIGQSGKHLSGLFAQTTGGWIGTETLRSVGGSWEFKKLCYWWERNVCLCMKNSLCKVKLWVNCRLVSFPHIFHSSVLTFYSSILSFNCFWSLVLSLWCCTHAETGPTAFSPLSLLQFFEDLSTKH